MSSLPQTENALFVSSELFTSTVTQLATKYKSWLLHWPVTLRDWLLRNAPLDVAALANRVIFFFFLFFLGHGVVFALMPAIHTSVRLYLDVKHTLAGY